MIDYKNKINGDLLNRYKPCLSMASLIGSALLFIGCGLDTQRGNDYAINNILNHVNPLIITADSLINTNNPSNYRGAFELLERSRIYLEHEREKLIKINDGGYFDSHRIDSTLGKIEGLEKITKTH